MEENAYISCVFFCPKCGYREELRMSEEHKCPVCGETMQPALQPLDPIEKKK